MSIEVNILTQPKIQASIKTFVASSEDYQNGYSDGYAKGESDGEKQGAQAEYDRFWDGLQQKGARTDYYTGFYMWHRDGFKPKYDMRPTTAYMMFRFFSQGTDPVDLVELLQQQGVTLDFSNCSAVNGFQYTFQEANFSRLGVIDTSACSSLNSTFAGIKAHTIEKLILKSDGSQTFSNTLQGALNLENVIIEGVIGSNGFSVGQSTKLTHDSLMSIINALKDYSGSGTTYTLTLGATNLAKLTDAEKAIATQKGWTLA